MTKVFIVYCFDIKNKLHFEFIKASSFIYAKNKAYKKGYILVTDYEHALKRVRRLSKWKKETFRYMKW